MASSAYGLMATMPVRAEPSAPLVDGKVMVPYGVVDFYDEDYSVPPFTMRPCVGDDGQVQYQMGPKIPHAIKQVTDIFGFDARTPVGTPFFIEGCSPAGYYVIVSLPTKQKPYYLVEPYR